MEFLVDFIGGGFYSLFFFKGYYRFVKYIKLYFNYDGDDESLYGDIVNICKFI